MIEFVNGNFFDYDADIRVNTVNCVGVMGAGVALAFKTKYPSMFNEYVKQCKSGELKPGKPSVWEIEDMFSKKLSIINFPTKDDWRNPSKYEYIESGLDWLSNYLSKRENLTITLPALGCGHGGLDWDKVKLLIEQYLKDSNHKILVFEPFSSKSISKENIHHSSYNINELHASGVEVMRSDSENYPKSLKLITEKDLLIFKGVGPQEIYDISIISSSRQNDDEKHLISSIIEICKRKKLSMLFGGSSFEKQASYIAARNGIRAGFFMPTGILKSAEKFKQTSSDPIPTLLSIGNPYDTFDKKAFMPTVFGRISMGRVSILTTNKFDWIRKHSKKISKLHPNILLLNASNDVNINFGENIHIKALNIEDLSSNLSELDNKRI
ncbi:macro domain-containing protein [Shewanella algae]|uniref:macro domain-containing protein n=1 Tax=Shewanella algae TaxID=38313 RepID=UPI001AAD740F|nr:macro domain-containing protein [Shewanella algae]MBO2653204.1 macro domain-containing protein [Shewanella algae]